jgi:hypothetical protein
MRIIFMRIGYFINVWHVYEWPKTYTW